MIKNALSLTLLICIARAIVEEVNGWTKNKEVKGRLDQCRNEEKRDRL